MKTQVYAHFLKGGESHFGIRYEDEIIAYSRPQKPESTQISALIDVYLNDDAPQNRESLFAVIDEAFQTIQKPNEAEYYDINTELGRFQYLYRAPYAKDAKEANQQLIKSWTF